MGQAAMATPAPAELFTTDNIDYFQRADHHPADLSPGAPLTSAGDQAFPNSVRVTAVGHLDKSAPRESRQAPPSQGESTLLLSENLIVGLYGHNAGMAFHLSGRPAGIHIHLGCWTPSRTGGSPGAGAQISQTMQTVLDGAYPGIKLEPASEPLPAMPVSGLVLGIPTMKPPDPIDGALPIDRLIRAMEGAQWAVLVLAQPIAEEATRQLRNKVLNEIRAVSTAAQTHNTPAPLAKHYSQLLETSLTALTHGQAVGNWRTAVYLMAADEAGYHRLAGAWRSIFAGQKSQPEPVRVWQWPAAARLADMWAMPDQQGLKGRGHYRHPFEYQTLLTSSQLAAYIHLPQLETSGFSVRVIPDFDIVPPPLRGGQPIELGRVIQNGRASNVPYLASHGSLASHTFVTGITGAGKTNTVIKLLREAAKIQVPFLVIEPAKAEYRALLHDRRIGPELQIFTPGSERVSPFRLNPLEVMPGTPLGTHIDLLRSVFTASFGMWTPMPQVLEQSLLDVYRDRGWDLTTGRNRRAGQDTAEADPASFPTLSDVHARVGELVPRMGFDPEARDRILASLQTRLNGLRTGGRGRMLDVHRSIPMSELLARPSVLELEGMGDDDDKAFLMGLLFIRLVEYRRAEEERLREEEETGGNRQARPELRHLLVIEEAHRLLTNAQRNTNEEQADPRGKIVEAFTNLLSEIRSYGQGVIIADQVPSRLAPDALKNTNLKLVHRIVAGDDRDMLGKAMGMSERQMAVLPSLDKGKSPKGVEYAEVVVHAIGDDAPLLIGVPRLRSATPPGDELVRRHMRSSPLRAALPAVFQRTLACATACTVRAPEECSAAQAIVEDLGFRRVLTRLALTAIEDEASLGRTWPELQAVVRAARPEGIDDQRLIHCVCVRAASWLAGRQGARQRWSYPQADEFERKLRAVLLAAAASGSSIAGDVTVAQFQEVALRLHARTHEPYPLCGETCNQRVPTVCLYRHFVAELLYDEAITGRWRAASRPADAPRADQGSAAPAAATSAEEAAAQRGIRQWEVSSNAAYQLIDDVSSGAGRRTAWCFAQQMTFADSFVPPKDRIKSLGWIPRPVSPGGPSSQST
jgi:hypothetical protein